MRKVKVFKFTVTNWTTAGGTLDEIRSQYFQEAASEVWSPKEVEKAINDWADSNEYQILDIKVTTVDVRYCTGSGTNTVVLWYTILYELGVRNDK